MTLVEQRTFNLATIADLAAMRQFLHSAAAALGVDAESAGDMVLAANEAASNVLRHGYGGQPGDLTLIAARDSALFSVTLRDHAPLYDPTRRPEPDTALGLTQRSPGGMGVHLMREFTDELRYRVTAEGYNELVLVKYLPDQA